MILCWSAYHGLFFCSYFYRPRVLGHISQRKGLDVRNRDKQVYAKYELSQLVSEENNYSQDFLQTVLFTEGGGGWGSMFMCVQKIQFHCGVEFPMRYLFSTDAVHSS